MGVASGLPAQATFPFKAAEEIALDFFYFYFFLSNVKYYYRLMEIMEGIIRCCIVDLGGKVQ